MNRSANRKQARCLVFLVMGALLLGCFPPSVKAADSQMTTLDISRGNIVIAADSVSGYAPSGEAVTQPDAAGYHIVQSTYGTTAHTILIKKGADTHILADSLHIQMDYNNYGALSPLFIEPGASLQLTLKGENAFYGPAYNAGIGVPQDTDGTMAELTIDGDGSATCYSAKRGAGIGGGQRCGYTEAAGKIVINSGTITAIGGQDGNGYGGGIGNAEIPDNAPNDCVIVINGGSVTANAVQASSGIGGGRSSRACKADVTINGGVVSAQGAGDHGIRANSIEINGGNVIALDSVSDDNWQSFSTPPRNSDGEQVKIASVKLGPIDYGASCQLQSGSFTSTVISSSYGRVNALIPPSENTVDITTAKQNVYRVDWSALSPSTQISYRPYAFPVLTIVPDSGQSFFYGDPAAPTYKLYSGSSVVADDLVTLDGALRYDAEHLSPLPSQASILPGSIRRVAGDYCIEFDSSVTCRIEKRKIAVSADDLTTHYLQYSRYQLPFVFHLEAGSLLAGDTLEDAFYFSAKDLDYFPPVGRYENTQFSFYSDYYDVELVGSGPALTVLENSSLLQVGETLRFGTDAAGAPIEWVVSRVDENGAYLYSKWVYDDLPYDQISAQRYSYLQTAFPSLDACDFVSGGSLLDSRYIDAYAPSIKEDYRATASDQTPKAYWLFSPPDDIHTDGPYYVDTDGSIRQATDSTFTAGVRLALEIDINSHTVPGITLSDLLAVPATYGDIGPGDAVGQVTDNAVLTGHHTTSFSLTDGEGATSLFSLDQNGTIYAEQRLAVGSYRLTVQAVDDTGYVSRQETAFTVKKKEIAITPASDLTIQVGDSAPALPYTYSEADLLPGDVFTGELAVGGDLSEPGQYPITLGSLSAGDNYRLLLNGPAYLTVREKTSPPDGPDTDTPDDTPAPPDEHSGGQPKTAAPTGDTSTNGSIRAALVLAAAGAALLLGQKRRQKS